jgi:hypothetical protein
MQSSVFIPRVRLVLEHPRHFLRADEYHATIVMATEALTDVLTATSASDRSTIVGLDAEWTTREDLDSSSSLQKKKRVCSKLALLQLALFPSATTVCLRLFPQIFDDSAALSPHWGPFLTTLKAFLEHRNIVKCGVGVDNDVKKLREDWGLATNSWVDLCGLQASIPRPVVDGFMASPRPDRWCPKPTSSSSSNSIPRSLRDLAAVWLGRELGKCLSIALSDWADVTVALSEDQLEYAVGDAVASRDVAVAMLRVSVEHLSSDEHTQAAEREKLIVSVRDRPAIELIKSAKSSAQSVGDTRRQSTKHRRRCQEPSATEVERASSWLEVRKKAYYDNIMTFDPDGALLFTIDKKKAEWYVTKKGLGRVTEYRRLSDDALIPASDIPLDDVSNASTMSATYAVASIQLTFKPDFERFEDTHIRRDLEYFRQPKDNRCVVCGLPDKVIRCAVVPLMYRKYFPKTYVSHNSYDLLLVCPQCFVKVNYYHDREREAIAAEYQFPLATNQKIIIAAVERQSVEGANVPCASSTDLNLPLTPFELTRQSRHTVQQVVKFACALLRNLKATEPKFEMDHSDSATIAETIERGNSREKSSEFDNAQRSSSFNPRASRKPSSGEGKAVRNAAWIPLNKLAAMESFVVKHAPAFSAFECGLLGGEGDAKLTPEVLEKLSRADVHTVVSAAVCDAFPLVGAVNENLPSSVDGSAPAQQLRVDNHAAYVVSQVLQKYPGNVDAGVGEFILRWRQLFVEKLQPTHLPTGWRVDDGILLLPPS